MRSDADRLTVYLISYCQMTIAQIVHDNEVRSNTTFRASSESDRPTEILWLHRRRDPWEGKYLSIVSITVLFEASEKFISVKSFPSSSIAILSSSSLEFFNLTWIIWQLMRIWQVMDKCIRTGVSTTERTLPGRLGLRRRAPILYRRLMRGFVFSRLLAHLYSTYTPSFSRLPHPTLRLLGVLFVSPEYQQICEVMN